MHHDLLLQPVTLPSPCPEGLAYYSIVTIITRTLAGVKEAAFRVRACQFSNNSWIEQEVQTEFRMCW
jgi:hypothetical protein